MLMGRIYFSLFEQTLKGDHVLNRHNPSRIQLIPACLSFTGQRFVSIYVGTNIPRLRSNVLTNRRDTLHGQSLNYVKGLLNTLQGCRLFISKSL